MKRTLLLSVMAIFTLQSCLKDLPPVPNPYANTTTVDEPAFIVVTSFNNEDTYHPGNAITINWKSENVPKGAVINARLKSIGDYQFTAFMHPEHDLDISRAGATADDGQETFYLPGTEGKNNVYLQLGAVFRIELTVNYADPDKANNEGQTVLAQTLSQIFVITADGCTSSYGHSVTDGHPCSVPYK